MSESDAVKKSKIFVYGQIGKDLKEEDEERVLACLEANPNTTLFNIARKRIQAIRDRLRQAHDKSNPAGVSQARDDLEAEIKRCNKFREIARWMHNEMDELSMGSTILGEVSNPEAEMDEVFEEDYENDDDYNDTEEQEE